MDNAHIYNFFNNFDTILKLEFKFHPTDKSLLKTDVNIYYTNYQKLN